jgi:hypothetical protein
MSMRLHYLSPVLIVGFSWVAGAQTTQAPPSSPPGRALTLIGCVQRNEANSDQYTLVNGTDKTTYRLSGVQVREYVGRRVQVIGGVVDSKRLKISGGLRPTPNVAAQAGAMDPSQAATAAAGGSAPGTGPAPTLEFKIKSISPTEGGCP